MASTKDKIRERKLDRMRQGQAVADVVSLTSDPEIKFYIVPLTEAEYTQVLQEVANTAAPADFAGMQIRDRVHARGIIVRAVREPSDLSKPVFDDVDEMMQDLEATDIDDIYLKYQEMSISSSPSLDGISEEELDDVKKALQTMDWNELSGRSWFALKHFLGTIMPSPLLDNSPGFTSTNSSITTSE